jgi:hypothetical protein
MKKYIFVGIAVLSIATIAVFNVNLSIGKKNEMSLLVLANVEALANNETPPNVITCYSTIRVTPKEENIYEPIWVITDCNGCLKTDCFEYRDSGTCTKEGGIIFV